jgi:RNA polymerase sigma factor (sigma-70 family)
MHRVAAKLAMVPRGSAQLEQRFRDLYDRTYNRVFAYALRRVFIEQEARDVVSDTYMNVWRRVRDLPADPDLADAWVFGTARRVLSNYRRARSRRERLTERLAGQRVADSPNEAPGSDAVRRALVRLPDKYREVLELSTWEELTHSQIAAVVGCSENAVAIRLHRARTALRDSYDGLLEKGEAS